MLVFEAPLSVLVGLIVEYEIKGLTSEARGLREFARLSGIAIDETDIEHIKEQERQAHRLLSAFSLN